MLPLDIENSLKKDFHFPEEMVFCQMATQSKHGPHVRTVRLYDIEKEKGFIFVTHTASKKWYELKNNFNMAVCFLHPEYHIQLRAECHVALFDYKSAPFLAEKCWKMIREDVKKIYHDDRQDERQIPDCFGLIAGVPHICEYLCIDSDYANSIRYIYMKDSSQGWLRKQTLVV
jgi:uncharacterized pyridoxamine 5'-phosphate oxidase family protein